MSLNITDEKPYLLGCKKDIKTIVFGGGIKMGTAKLDNGFKVLIMGDIEGKRPIGEACELKKEQFFDDVSGDVVCLAFDKKESIDVVIEFLNEAKGLF